MFWDWIKEKLRSKFYDGVEVGGSFTETDSEGRVGDIYHIFSITDSTITYQHTWYGYKSGKPVTVSKREFKGLVQDAEYHGKDYLYALT